MEFRELYKADLARWGNRKESRWLGKYLYYLRRVSTCKNKVLFIFYRFKFRRYSQMHGMEIPKNTQIGKGLYIGHPFNITINGDTILGENVNIHKGVTIGQENRGKRKGTPVIGNKVWIGVNATIVGAINIGDDVLIAPNTYVNCDVPPHSVVLGNPCKIMHKDNATEGYINNYV